MINKKKTAIAGGVGALAGGIIARQTDPRKREIAKLKLKIKQGQGSPQDKLKLQELRKARAKRTALGVAGGGVVGAGAAMAHKKFGNKSSKPSNPNSNTNNPSQKKPKKDKIDKRMDKASKKIDKELAKKGDWNSKKVIKNLDKMAGAANGKSKKQVKQERKQQPKKPTGEINGKKIYREVTAKDFDNDDFVLHI
jgi:hypothetical protein